VGKALSRHQTYPQQVAKAGAKVREAKLSNREERQHTGGSITGLNGSGLAVFPGQTHAWSEELEQWPEEWSLTKVRSSFQM